MSKKNKVKSMTLSSIIFFGLLFILSSLCYAQFTQIGYPSYLYGEYPGSYSMFGMYDSLFRTMIPLSMMNGLEGIYGLDGVYGLDGIYSSFIGPEITGGPFGIYNVLGGLGIMNGPDDTYRSYDTLGIMGGIFVIYSGLSSLDMTGEVSRMNTPSITSGFGYLESPGLAGLGSLAGLGGLGSGAGLISSETTDITSYWGI